MRTLEPTSHAAAFARSAPSTGVLLIDVLVRRRTRPGASCGPAAFLPETSSYRVRIACRRREVPRSGRAACGAADVSPSGAGKSVLRVSLKDRSAQNLKWPEWGPSIP